MVNGYLAFSALCLNLAFVQSASNSEQHRYWNTNPSHLNRRRDSKYEPSSSEATLAPTFTLMSSETTPLLVVKRNSVINNYSSTFTTQTTKSSNSERALFTSHLPKQVGYSSLTGVDKVEQSLGVPNKLLGLPLAAGIGIIAGVALILCIILGFFSYIYIKRRQASSWPKSAKDLQGYIDLHDVPTTPRRVHPPPLLSSSDEGHGNSMHPSMHPAVISARAKINGQLSTLSHERAQPEMSEAYPGYILPTNPARSAYPKPTIYRLSVVPMLGTQPSYTSSTEKCHEAEALPDYSFVMSAILPYKPRQDGEIDVSVGDELAITDEMGLDWLIGSNLTTNSTIGGFPRTCVTGNSYQ
ncbi:hypothetical protein K7432_005325 [Basidiobolus ranarum]|uniref:SH3 domain-containing protein n=1 Tax=Basidiobolus ranarum TaxID=34480 RepID=A0ABR2WWV2_9FUNG